MSEWYRAAGLSEYQARRPTVRNPPMSATNGAAPRRWRSRRMETACRTRPLYFQKMRKVQLGGAGVAVGSGIGKLDGVAVGAAVGLSVGVSVGTGDSDGVGVKAGARVSGAGVGSEHPARVARNTRMMKVAWRNGFSTWSFLFLWWDQPSILLVARPVPLAPIVRNLGALVPFSMSCLRTSGPCSPGPVEVKIPAGVRRGSWAVCCNAPELFRSVDVAASGAPAPRLCSCSGLLRRRWPLGLPCSPWPWPVWQPIPWPFGRRPVGR